MKLMVYRRYLLAVLMVILAFNYADRVAVGVALQSIKVDLHLSDTQLGLLTGIAFAFLYSTMGIPIARWADRGNRVSIISLAVAVWGIMVAITGRATNFVQMFLIRSAVAVGDAGCVPPANSIIPDYFSRAERPKAAGVYMAGASGSIVIGYFLGGWLNQLYGWRIMFMVLGLPGILLAVLAKFTLREPRLAGPSIRTVGSAASPGGDGGGCREATAASIDVSSPSQSPTAESSASTASVREICVTLWANATYRQLVFCSSVVSFFSQGSSQWLPAYFMRSYGLNNGFNTGKLGTWFALIGLAGLVGVNLGGALASRYAPHNERLQFRAIAVACTAYAAVWSAIYLTHNYYVNFALLGLGTFGVSTITGPLLGSIQSLVPPGMRAMSFAILMLFSNLIGMGLGPLAVGALSDALHPLFLQESLRYALLALSPGYIWAGWEFWRASKTVTGDIDVLRESLNPAGECTQAEGALAQVGSLSAREGRARLWWSPRRRGL